MSNKTLITATTLGDLITVLYEEYLSVYGDEDVASVAAAATINDLIGQPDEMAYDPVADAA